MLTAMTLLFLSHCNLEMLACTMTGFQIFSLLLIMFSLALDIGVIRRVWGR
jgi:hypothetical protein